VLTVRIDLDGRLLWGFVEAEFGAGGVLVHCEEGEERGLEFCVMWARNFRDNVARNIGVQGN
jgi:hypothetical protein